MVSVGEGLSWQLGFAHQNWSLSPGETFAISLTFDGQSAFNVQGRPLNAHLMQVGMPANSALMPGTLRRIHALLAADGLFISKTPCVGNMNPLIRLVLPAMRAIGMAPYAGVFRGAELGRLIGAAGFEILATENHAGRGDDNRPFIVARKR